MGKEDVLVRQTRNALWITLNRPDRKNAFDSSMCDRIISAVRDAAQSDIDVIVVTGSGDSFCSGGYLGGTDEPDPVAIRTQLSKLVEMLEIFRKAPQPVIAAVNGLAVGGGNELVIACDLAVAAESAWLGQSGVRVGSAPVFGGTNMLSMIIGEKRAKEVAFLCRRYPARQALELGWLNAVVPDEDLHSAVESLIEELRVMSPRYLEIAKISSNLWWNLARDSYASGLGMLLQAIGSPDMREGSQAFMERRKPRFPGRSGTPRPEAEPIPCP